MLGGLYGDLPPPISAAEDESSGGNNHHSNVWSTTAKMAPPTLRNKSLYIPTQSLNPKPHSKPKPIIRVSDPVPIRDEIGGIRTKSLHPALVGVSSTVVEEYDPARPNDYEEYKREKKRREREIELEKRRQQDEEDRERKEKEREAASARKREKDTKDLNISGEEAWRRRQAMAAAAPVPRSPSPPPAGGDGFSIGSSESGGLGIGAGGQMSAAQRMMAKMGWKHGQGLGKQEQGITTPLVHKKTDRRAGVIVNASEAKPEKKVKSVNLKGVPTRVLLLKNMVGPGEVDDELEVEVAEECAKYGKVTRVLIFEITEQNFPSDEAVRIFVQFERSEQTTKALIDLDGRFFGGRVVKAGFYEEEKFNKNELAPVSGEIPGF